MTLTQEILTIAAVVAGTMATRFLPFLMKLCPSRRMRREPTYEVIDLFNGAVPVNAAGFLEYLWCRMKDGSFCQFFLWNSLHTIIKDSIDSLQHQITP